MLIDAQQTTQAVEDITVTNVADLMLAYLNQIGTEYVFGVPGGAIEPLFDALARDKRRDGIQIIVARHETGAAFMADGYASLSGKLGVCCSTTGPGATNLITGVASAYENRVPMLVITAQTSMENFGKRAFQESSCTGTNIVAMFEHCTRYNSFVSDINQLERKIIAAITAAFRYPQGPVHLSIPLNILRMPAKSNHPAYDLNKMLDNNLMLDKAKTRQFYTKLKESKKTVFVLGRRSGGAVGSILELADEIDAVIVTTPGGKGFVNPYHPRFRGVFGIAGHESAGKTLGNSSVDLVVLVGSNIGEWAVNGINSKAVLNRRLVHVDSDAECFSRSPMANLQIGGDIESIFKYILNDCFKQSKNVDAKKLNVKLTSSSNSQTVHLEKILPFIEILPGQPKRYFQLEEENKYLDDSSPIKPQRLMRELARQFPVNTLFLADTGNSMLWGIHDLHPFDRRVGGGRTTKCGVFRTTPEFASMGWAIGSAVGTALADRSLPVVCLTGDGSMLMSGQEITVAIVEKLTVIFVVLNDSSLGMVRHGQKLAKAENIGTELPATDFSLLAQSMGVQSYQIRSPQDMLELDVHQICSKSGPTLLDVYIDPDEVPPLKTRVNVLAGGE